MTTPQLAAYLAQLCKSADSVLNLEATIQGELDRFEKQIRTNAEEIQSWNLSPAMVQERNDQLNAKNIELVEELKRVETEKDAEIASLAQLLSGKVEKQEVSTDGSSRWFAHVYGFCGGTRIIEITGGMETICHQDDGERANVGAYPIQEALENVKAGIWIELTPAQADAILKGAK